MAFKDWWKKVKGWQKGLIIGFPIAILIIILNSYAIILDKGTIDSKNLIFLLMIFIFSLITVSLIGLVISQKEKMKEIYKYILVSEIIGLCIVVLGFSLTFLEGIFKVNIVSSIGFFLIITPLFITYPIFKFFPQEGGGDLLLWLMVIFLFYSIIAIIIGLLIYLFVNKIRKKK